MLAALRTARNNPVGYITENNVVLCETCLSKQRLLCHVEKITRGLGPWDHYPICDNCGAVIEQGVVLSGEARADIAAERLRSGLARIWSRGQAWYYAVSERPREPRGGFKSYMEAFDKLGYEVTK